MNPGVSNQKFEMKFSENWLRKGSVLDMGADKKIKVEVISEPKLYYNKWYWKILNFLTFKLCFNVKYTYTCKIINKR